MDDHAIDAVSIIEEVRAEAQSEARPAGTPGVVSIQASVLLGTLLAKEGEGWLTRFGGTARVLRADTCVDPALLDDALRRGVRVLVEQGGETSIAGVVATQRSLVIDRDGCVDAEVERFEVSARQEVLLKTPGAFLRARRRDIEVFGDKVLTRGRELAKIIAAMIELN